MNLWLVRHGIAHEIGEAGAAGDADRTLSPKGVRRTRDVARALHLMGVRPATLLSSPLPRALETARILAATLTPDTTVEIFPALSPGARLPALLQRLTHFAPDTTVMAVGHMPDLADIAARLIGPSGDANLRFGKAAVCEIRFAAAPAPGAGRLTFLLQSGKLRAVSRRGP